MEDEFKVSADAQVKYLLRRIGELSDIETSDAVNFDLAKKTGHQIKGNADSFEFPNLTEMARILEAKADQSDEAAVREVVRNLLKSMRAHLKELAP
ncbi:Hpt domain-containing protein [Bdellovibrio sp. HCB288]|uniref:Hpt domain-containing protein n=1 Tax=Bdellovibrio sp. HCB288 TaxID=3394355 RepID=UPI0039B541E8